MIDNMENRDATITKKLTKEDQTLEQIIESCKVVSDKLCELLKQNDSTKLVAPPDFFKKTLKEYQRVGLNWLVLLYKENINGILADEMGLGKTIQSICLLSYIFTKNDKGPHLIIVPASTLSNWQREFKECCKEINVFLYYGSQVEREEQQDKLLRQFKSDPDKRCHVILTTYTVALQKRDKHFLKKLTYSYLILDEAQLIKNSKTQRFQKLKTIPRKHTLLLTGTPLQNNLLELWTLLHFMMPNIFNDNSKTFFKELSAGSMASKFKDLKGKDNYIQQMKTILSPFMLRRLKTEVELQLPTKAESITFCKQTELQNQLYSQILKQSRSAWNKSMHKDSSDKENVNNNKHSKGPTLTKILSNTLMELRKVTNHPLLCRYYYDDKKLKQLAPLFKSYEDDFENYTVSNIVEELKINSDFAIHQICSNNSFLKEHALSTDYIINICGKFKELSTILPQRIANGDRILLFSQMTRMMDISEVFLNSSKIKYLRLDGTTSVLDRQELIDTFNNDKSYSVFLLSTLAGGVGINLASANVVIFYDISFNPSIEKQAEDRSHRLGQEKDVTVIKLITKDTVEENILKMSTDKKLFNDNMLEENQNTENLTEEKSLVGSTKFIRRLFENLFKNQPQD